MVTNQVLENMKNSFFSTQIENFANFAKCQNLNFESEEVVGWHVGSLDRAEAMQGVWGLVEPLTITN